ncbi:programmed cell death 1 ligand 1-like [Oreochromis aureus]|uniref:Ig-like domain-containing protein n=1 Tax=Oreochromis aureus TaxID=47969 RepID=A0AAZ1Y2I9_OREAU|nr:programmed cell death 1 ligand 1-like [Oreochromis aureus]
MKRSRIMAGIKGLVFLVVLTFQWTHVTGDTEVSCIFMESCMLPCSYGGRDVVIHWIQVSTGDITVHSFYHNQDQLERQNQHFRGRTSLFNDQISTGNASLQLTKVEVQDEGKYKCYISTIDGNKESFINLKIDAQIQKVNIQQVGNIITCSSEGIYPKPELTWSTSPPSNITSKDITVQPTEQLLYNISSSLIVSDSETDLDYSCTISTRRNRKKATLFKPDPANDSPQSPNSNQLRATRGGIIGGLFVIAALAVLAVSAAVLCWSKKKDVSSALHTNQESTNTSDTKQAASFEQLLLSSNNYS